MAERRMFAKSVINSARFLRMPPTSRLLYYDLGMAADDDGVVEAFAVMRVTGAVDDDLRVLITKGFVTVLDNDDLISYINDWTTNNKIRPDRKTETVYKDLLLQVLPDAVLIPPRDRADTKSKHGRPVDVQRTTDGQPMDGIGKDRIGKDRTGKNRLGENIAPTSNESKPETAPEEPVFIELPLITGEKYPVTQSQVDRWKQIYPRVDVEQALRSMYGWLEGSPKKRKTKRGITRFIVNWLDGDQNSGKHERKENSNGPTDAEQSVWDYGTI